MVVTTIQGFTTPFAAVLQQLIDGLLTMQNYMAGAQGPYPQSADAINHQLFALLQMVMVLIQFTVHLSPGM